MNNQKGYLFAMIGVVAFVASLTINIVRANNTESAVTSHAFSQRKTVGPIQDGKAYVFKIKGAEERNRFLCYHTEQLVGFLCDKESPESVWGITFLAGRASIGGNEYPELRFVTGIVDEKRCHGHCYLSGTLKKDFLSLDHHMQNTFWTIIDNENGTVVIAFLEPRSGPAYTDIIAVHYLKADTTSQKFSFVSKKEEATIWYPMAQK